MKGVSPLNQRTAEKQHVRLMASTTGLEAKPFLAGTSLNVDNALIEIAIFSAMVNSLPCGPGSLVLDLGAGPCWVSDWLQKLKFRTLSLDLAEDMLRIGKKRLAPSSRLCVGDMAAIPLRDQTVDAALCYAALHHVPNWPTALQEIHRVLRPGGVLVLQEPGRGHHRHADSIVQMEQFGVLEQELPVRVLVRACRKAGFTRVIVRPVAEIYHGRSRILPPYRFWRQAPKLFIRKWIHRLKASVVEQLLNLVCPLNLVVAIKGRPWADSRRPDTLVARFLRVECPGVVEVGRPISVRVRVLNTGLTRWLARTDSSCLGQVRLGVSLLDQHGRMRNLDFARLDLPHDVEPGGEVEVEGEIPPLRDLGRVGLRFDLVAEGVCWFSARGSRSLVRHCEVRPATPSMSVEMSEHVQK